MVDDDILLIIGQFGYIYIYIYIERERERERGEGERERERPVTQSVLMLSGYFPILFVANHIKEIGLGNKRWYFPTKIPIFLHATFRRRGKT